METANGNKNRDKANGTRYRFDEFEIDPVNRLLLLDGKSVPVTGKVFDVLLVFVENPGRLLEKDELIEKVWPGEFVEEGNLARNVSTLRKALGDTGTEHKYITTVQGRGYRFVADIASNQGRGTFVEPNEVQMVAAKRKLMFSRPYLWIAAVLVLAVLVAGGAIGKAWFFPEEVVPIKSLAVLPLRPIDASGNELGFGIADSIIRRLSSTGSLIVRPTSAVRPYITKETDGLTAGRELGADAVLEGTVQRDNDRLRISVNLLRTSDGASLWADNFDLSITDIFAIQDTVSQQVASRLRLKLNREQTARLNKNSTVNPIAYEYYLKGMYSFDLRGLGKKAKPQALATIELFRKAIDADSQFALAYAQLANIYGWLAIQIEPSDPEWPRLADEAIKTAENIDPTIAETHLARSLLLSGSRMGWQTEAALRELLVAQKLDPNVAHVNLADLYYHLGLEKLADREFSKAIEVDPTSQNAKIDLRYYYNNMRRFDELESCFKQYFPNESFWASYFIGKRRFDEAARALDDELSESPENLYLLADKAKFLALTGDSSGAESLIPRIVAEFDRANLSHHHLAYEIACIFSMLGNRTESLKWLRESSTTGFDCYSLFLRDAFLDPIRQTPEFIAFMAEAKIRNERYTREFQ